MLSQGQGGGGSQSTRGGQWVVVWGGHFGQFVSLPQGSVYTQHHANNLVHQGALVVVYWSLE